MVIKHRAQYLLVFERVPCEIELYLWAGGAPASQEVVFRFGCQDKFRLRHWLGFLEQPARNPMSIE
jgi:hypothetical protein